MKLKNHSKAENTFDTTFAARAVEPQAATIHIGKKLDPEFVDNLMRQLNEAEGSQMVPRWMEQHERDALLERLTRQARSQKRSRRLFQVIFAIGVTLVIGLSVASLLSLTTNMPLTMMPLIITYGLASLCGTLANQKWGRTVAKMTQFDDLRATGPLLEALDLHDKTVVHAAETALLRLLPRLQASDSNVITDIQRECLYRRLKIQNVQTEAEFLVVALKALEQVGDAKAFAMCGGSDCQHR